MCQKNIRKKSQFSESNLPCEDSIKNMSTDDKVLEPAKDNICGDQNLDGCDVPIPDAANNQSMQFNGKRSISCNSNASNSDTRSTDSGSEEAKNDSGLGGSVSSTGSGITRMDH